MILISLIFLFLLLAWLLSNDEPPTPENMYLQNNKQKPLSNRANHISYNNVALDNANYSYGNTENTISDLETTTEQTKIVWFNQHNDNTIFNNNLMSTPDLITDIVFHNLECNIYHSIDDNFNSVDAFNDSAISGCSDSFNNNDYN